MRTELRRLLEDIPRLETNRQQLILENIRRSRAHSIEVIESDHLFHEWGTYNCFEYALGLTDSRDYIEVKKQNVFANSEFINFLLENGLIEKNGNDGVIIYFGEGAPKHAGLFQSSKINSKWGTSLVFNHGVFEVPLSYGEECAVYKSVDKETMLEYFYNYAETKGIQFTSED